MLETQPCQVRGPLAKQLCWHRDKMPAHDDLLGLLNSVIQ
jgi:hypothetical protein